MKQALSIVIPTYNEAATIGPLLRYLRQLPGEDKTEIVVADGGSTDDTASEVRAHEARWIACPRRGRAAQLNFGARQSSTSLLFFLHSDCRPPRDFIRQVTRSTQQGIVAGCFRLRFDYPQWFLWANAWFTRFNVNAVRFGDQGLFITRPLFEELGGFREDLRLMEDQEMVRSIRKRAPFVVLPDYMTTSARKYRDNGVYRLQWLFFRIWWMHYQGRPHEEIVEFYQKKIIDERTPDHKHPIADDLHKKPLAGKGENPPGP